MEKKEITLKSYSIFLKNLLMVSVVFFLFTISNNAYSFCDNAEGNEALCNYEEVGVGNELPFCDNEDFIKLYKSCTLTKTTGACDECNKTNCVNKPYYVVTDEEGDSFNVYERKIPGPQKCQGYLPTCNKLKPAERDPIDPNKYPKEIDGNCISLEGYCSDLSRTGELKFPEGQNSNASNCLLKSCLHLSIEEMKKLHEKYDGSNKIFCSKKAWKKNPDTSLFYFSPNENYRYLKCYDFSLEQLDYTIVQNNALGNKGYCYIHDCPLPAEGMSKTCSNDSDKILKRDILIPGYKAKYEEKVLGGNAIGTNGEICLPSVDSCPFSRAGKRWNCVRDEVTGNYSLNENCDTCFGVDKNLPNSNQCSQTNPDRNPYNTQRQTDDFCTEENGYTCIQTIDCGVDREAFPDYDTFPECQEFTEQILGQDPLSSWFYRPIPSNLAFKQTYGIPENDNMIDDDNHREDRDFLFFNNMHTDQERNEGNKEYESENICMTRDDLQFYNGNCYPNLTGDPKVDSVATIFTPWTTFKEHNKNGECYMGWIGYHAFTTTNERFSPPFCPQEYPNTGKKLGGKGYGRTYACGNGGFKCKKPDMNSFYIRGLPSINWSVDKPKNVEVEVEVCMRFNNTGDNNVCGKRECRVDCAFDSCLAQWCGNDYCETLKISGKEDCALTSRITPCNKEEDPDCEDTVEDGLPEDAECLATLAGRRPEGQGETVMRARGRKYGNKVCIFLDSLARGCIGEGQMGITRREGFRTADQYAGRLDGASLFDDNSLTDHNKDGKINDKDVLGERIFYNFECADNKERDDEECMERAILNYIPLNIKRDPLGASGDVFSDRVKECHEALRGEGGELVHYCLFGYLPDFARARESWVTWDVIQYIGNNQPKDSEVCEVGNPNISKCRGFYDKRGIFHQEQQCITLPLPTGPPDFYKYATPANTPDLFMPILYIESIKNLSGDFIDAQQHQKTITNFFEPTVRLRYGATLQIDGMSFGNKESNIKEITTPYSASGSVTARYKFVKSSSLFIDDPNPQLCLYQVLKQIIDGTEEDHEMLIQCASRELPEITNFVLKQHSDMDYNNIKVNAYFSKDSTLALENMNNSKLSNNGLFSKFTRTSAAGHVLDYLEDRDFGHSEGYVIYTKKSFCSSLYSECIANLKLLYKETMKQSSQRDELLLRDYQRTNAECEIVIQKECDKRDGYPTNIIFNDTLKTIKEDNNLYGAQNEICISEGFNSKLENILAFAPVNGALGKCVLDDNSKKNPDCRYNSILSYCENTEDSDCMEISDGIYVKEINCECSDNDNDENACIRLSDECFFGGYNSNESVLKKDGTKDVSCKCKIAPDNYQSFGNKIVRKETLREAGLCIDMPYPPLCPAVHYKNKNGLYEDGGEGEFLNTIQTDYKSNIWRTEQKMYGSIQKDLGHAEFGAAVACEDGENDCMGADTDGYVIGECKGFWKNRPGTLPMAKCKSVGDINSDGKIDYDFELKEDTGCIRYSCLEKTTEDPQPDYRSGYALLAEVDSYNITGGDELTDASVDPRGRSHGFAIWDKYTKTNDNLEEVRAKRCLTGYGPAGTNLRLEKYMPILTPRPLSQLTSVQHDVVERLIGYDKNNDLYHYTADGLTDLTDNLPIRYCNQKGQWMEVRDVYNKGRTENYYATSNVWHSIQEDGIITSALNSSDLTDIEKSKYCERLYCPTKTIDNVVDLYWEDNYEGSTNYITYTTGGDKAYSNGEINKNTYWRHVGGAAWNEMPSSKIKEVETMATGECQNEASFYTHDTEFLSTFSEQLNYLTNTNLGIATIVSLKDKRLATETSPQTQPTRGCNNLGLWGPITNKCKKSCEMLDMYHTIFAEGQSSLNTDNIIAIDVSGDLNRFTTGETINGLTYGDDITGGAKWKRTLSGPNLVEGVCDTGPMGQSTDKMFVQNPSGPPMRLCQVDGTWGEIQNKCIHFKSCAPLTLTNVDLFGADDVLATRDVITWEGGISLPQTDEDYMQEVEADCIESNGYEGTGIKRTCSIATGDWSEAGTGTCQPKKCGTYNGYYAAKMQNLPTADTHAVRETGLKSYVFTSTCRSGLVDYGNGVELHCALDEDNNPVWEEVRNDCEVICTKDSPVYGANGVMIKSELSNSVYYSSLDINATSISQGENKFSKVQVCRRKTDNSVFTNLSDLEEKEEVIINCGSNESAAWDNKDYKKYTCKLNEEEGFAYWENGTKACAKSDLKAIKFNNADSSISTFEWKTPTHRGIPSGSKLRADCSQYDSSRTIGGGYASCSDGEWVYEDVSTEGTNRDVGCFKKCPSTSGAEGFDLVGTVCSKLSQDHCNNKNGGYEVEASRENKRVQFPQKIHGERLRKRNENAFVIHAGARNLCNSYANVNLEVFALCINGTWKDIYKECNLTWGSGP